MVHALWQTDDRELKNVYFFLKSSRQRSVFSRSTSTFYFGGDTALQGWLLRKRMLFC
jgi:hypothetical protein